MDRILIIGNGGSGKSTLAKKLSDKTGLPLLHLDKITWKSDLTPVPFEEHLELLRSHINKPSWIIEGWSYQSTMQERLKAASLIIFLDFPLWLCYWRAVKRQVKSVFRQDPYAPAGVALWTKTNYIFKAIARVHELHLPEVRSWLKELPEATTLLQFGSKSQVEKWFATFSRSPEQRS